MKGTIFDIQRFSVHDGPGIRTTVFLKGCPLRCKWCHNPEGLRKERQLQFFSEACIGCGKCGTRERLSDAEGCPSGALKICGREIDTEELLAEVLKDRDFYGQDGGVTFSGGECLIWAEFLAEILALLKEQGIHTAVDTSGYVPWEAFEKTEPFTDLYLYDIKCATERLHKEATGVSNRLILENLQKLARCGKPIWIRTPVIPGVNDNEGELEAIAEIVAWTSNVQKVTLMPYHTLGKSKYATLGMEAPYHTEQMISKDALQGYKEIFRRKNIIVD